MVIKNNNINKDNDEIIHQASLGKIILIKNKKHFIIDDIIYIINNISCKLYGEYDETTNKVKSLKN
jgi:predicted site-specific integrase-resolvase